MGRPASNAIITKILHASVRNGVIGIFEAVVRQGLEIEWPSTGRPSNSLLQAAIAANNATLSRFLIEAGADIYAEKTTVSRAWRCKSRNHLCQYHECTRTKATEANCSGINWVYCCWRRRYNLLGATPLLLAANSTIADEILPLLFEAGARVTTEPIVLEAVMQWAGVEIVRSLLQAGGNANDYAFSLETFRNMPLSVVSMDGDIDVAELLLDYGAHPDGPLQPHYSDIIRIWGQDNLLNQQFRTPLFLAAEAGDIQIVQLLLEHGANPDISALDLIDPIDLEMGELKIADLPKRQQDSDEVVCLYPLQAAACLEDVSVAKLLLHYGSTINPRFGTSPLACAAYHNRVDAVRLLVQSGADVNMRSDFRWGMSALEAGFKGQNPDIVRVLRSVGANEASLAEAIYNKTSQLILAILGLSNRAELEILLNEGADVELPTKVNRKLLKLPRWVWQLNSYFRPYFDAFRPLQWAAVVGNIEAAELLCDAGADIDSSCGSFMSTALILAAATGNLGMVELLINRGADPNNIPQRAGITPLSAAILAGTLSVTRMLLQHGADPNLTPEAHWEGMGYISLGSRTADIFPLPLEAACAWGPIEMVQLLLDAGVSVDQGWAFLDAAHRNRVDSMNLLMQRGGNINRRHAEDDTPLQAIIRGGIDLHTLMEFVQSGADINALPATTGYGRTALQAAAERGCVEIVEYLLSNGAHVNAPPGPSLGITALQGAAIAGRLRITQILLEHGADIGAEPSPDDGRRAIDGAAEWGRLQTIKLLIDNYRGPQSKRAICDRALKYAKRENQWHVIEFLQSYQEAIPGDGASQSYSDLTPDSETDSMSDSAFYRYGPIPLDVDWTSEDERE